MLLFYKDPVAIITCGVRGIAMTATPRTAQEITAQGILQRWREHYPQPGGMHDEDVAVLVRAIATALTACAAQTREECAAIAKKHIGNCATNDPIEAGKNICAATIANEIAALRAQEPSHDP